MLRVALAAMVVLVGCRNEASPRVRPDEARVLPAPNPPAPNPPPEVPEPKPAPPPLKPLSKWSELASLMEPCVETGGSNGDTKVHVEVSHGMATILRVSCVAAGTSKGCIERAILSATYAPSMSTSDEALFITRRNAGLGPVRFGPVRVRTERDIKAAFATGGDVQLYEWPCE